MNSAAAPLLDPYVLSSFLPTANEADDIILSETIAQAETLLQQALLAIRPDEQAQAKQMAGLIADPAAKGLSMAMTDRLIRSANPQRTADGWRHLLSRFGLPRGFSFLDRVMLRVGAMASRFLPGVVMGAVRQRLRRDSRGVILSAEAAPLTSYLAARQQSGVQTNVNLLGEAVLGETEAQHRLEAVMALLARPDVNYVSVKLSAVFSQISSVAFAASLAEAKARLRMLYRAALPGGKFVNLDMEEYRDLELTTAAFREVLAESEFQQMRAGIVLQAYLPDSWPALQSMMQWALQRVRDGGSGIKVRLVKGANLAMENVEAELHGWTVAPYGSKVETDANFRRMLEFAGRPEHTAAVRVGVASHNLFDVALALVLRRRRELGAAVEIEMLEGMANHQARAVCMAADGLLVYAPIVADQAFGAALAYLMRRLDENTSPDNYLSGVFSFTPGSPAWELEKQRFCQGWNLRLEVSADSRRGPHHAPAAGDGNTFLNEPDTDFTQAVNRAALAAPQAASQPFPMLPPSADESGIDALLEVSLAAQPAWEALGTEVRSNVLRRCAEMLASHRFTILQLLRREGKKAAVDADAEISEAVDFARYYAVTGRVPAGVVATALGTVVITPPWNFPFAIPCGGVLAALMAGNAVILKPAPETPELGWLLVNLLWAAGVPREVLQFVTCDDGATGQALICEPRTAAVVLTGAYETARKFLSWRPSLRLFAETSGKNSLIVSAAADRDLAVKDLVRSAFGHAGQKCSAASLGILEAEVYDDPAFLRQLKDAAASLRVGSADDLTSVVTPLLRPAEGSLLRALTTLDPGETWLLEPQPSPTDPCLWSPGIKLGVQRNSWFQQTECFGPVLGLMRARDLAEAQALQNGIHFGLTAGIHTLDEREIARWQDQVQAGNLYINRPITGAIVQRQPFGGWKRSSLGPGAKAGGPNYVNLFRQLSDLSPLDAAEIERSYEQAWSEHFALAHDPTALRSERNTFRYRPSRGVILRLPEPDPAAEVAAKLAAHLTGSPLVISHATEESEEAFCARIPLLAPSAGFLRTVETPSDAILHAAYEADLNWIPAPISSHGRVELPRWLREQSISETRHRYGNLLPSLEPAR